MKRLDRLGSVAFVTITISLVFHLLGVSFSNWKISTCTGCGDTSPIASWTTSIRERCYDSSVASIFIPKNELNSSVVSNSFVTHICLPNEYIFPNEVKYANYCLEVAMNRSDTACSLRTFNPDYCHCDYTKSTKAVLATAVLSSFSLGILMFLTHFVSFVKIDYVLKWLLPLCLALLVFSIIFIIITLSVAGGTLQEDILELRYFSTLFDIAYANAPNDGSWEAYLKNQTSTGYKAKVGWCFGMEVLSLYFALVSLIIYSLMVLAKTRPEPRNNK